MPANPFDLSVLSDLSDQLASWEDQFVSEASYRQYQRACAWVVDETAKQVSTSMTAVLPAVIDRPTPWIRKAFGYTRSLGKGRGPGEVTAEAYVLPSQSAILKYAMGDDENVRTPGDVGLARDEILIPFWQNLALTQGIKRNAFGNLPGGVMARLQREVGGQVAKRRVAGRWGVYKGEIELHGNRVTAYIARPPKVKETRPGKAGYTGFMDGRGRNVAVPRQVSTDVPRILMLAVPKAVYRPVLQKPWDDAIDEAVRAIPDRMAAELADKVAHNAAKAGAPRMKPVRTPNQLAAAQSGFVGDPAARARVQALLARTDRFFR